jgi:allantoin racemase
MRILVINPNTSPEMTEDIGRAATRYARSDTEVVTVCPPWGPRSIEGHMEEVLAAHATVEVIADNRDAYDGFVIACFGDPGLYAAREVTSVPVVGIAEAAMLTACTVAHRFSVVTVLPRILPLLHDLVRANGLESRCASIRSTSLSVLEIEADPERAAKEILAESWKAIKEDEAEAICLGCAGMGPLDKKIQGALGVPVIDGVATGVKMLESLHDYGITTSKVAAFKDPEPKELVECSAALRAVASA